MMEMGARAPEYIQRGSLGGNSQDKESRKPIMKIEDYTSMSIFRIIILFVLALSGLNAAWGNRSSVNTFLVSGVLFMASIVLEAYLQVT